VAQDVAVIDVLPAEVDELRTTNSSAVSTPIAPAQADCSPSPPRAVGIEFVLPAVGLVCLLAGTVVIGLYIKLRLP
jgi:hypothetical protein